jgi:NTP pyrophosphatase (non-canonical NTP hydrolase)
VVIHPGWYGVDLDGTLAVYDGWKGDHVIGAPVPAMLERVKRWVAEGKEVRIVTARCDITARCDNGPEAIKFVADWSERYVGRRLPVTNIKDMNMIELWDDRCVQVVKNTGERVGDTPTTSWSPSSMNGPLDFSQLRNANVHRNRTAEKFVGCEKWSGAEWGCALAGETGEACNVVKKILRDGDTKPRRLELEKELADIICYTDLLAHKYGIDLGEAVRSKFNEVSDRIGSYVKI